MCRVGRGSFAVGYCEHAIQLAGIWFRTFFYTGGFALPEIDHADCLGGYRSAFFGKGGVEGFGCAVYRGLFRIIFHGMLLLLDGSVGNITGCIRAGIDKRASVLENNARESGRFCSDRRANRRVLVYCRGELPDGNRSAEAGDVVDVVNVAFRGEFVVFYPV